MHYDPVKRMLGRFFSRSPLTQDIFYRLLDILLLRTWHIHSCLKKISRKKGELNVLDAGSGLGQYTWYMARKNPNWKVTAVDIKEEEIRESGEFFRKKAIKNARFITGDLLNYNIPDYYDLILSVDVMEHIEQDFRVFSNFYRSLKPGGLLLISTPSDKGGSNTSEKNDTSFIEEHVRNGYSVAEIEQKLRNAGFESMEVKYTYGWPGNIAWHISMKYPMLMLRLSKTFIILLPFYYIITMPLVLLLNLADLKLTHTSGTGLMVKAWKQQRGN